jgi:hypothetical protein
MLTQIIGAQMPKLSYWKGLESVQWAMRSNTASGSGSLGGERQFLYTELQSGTGTRFDHPGG